MLIVNKLDIPVVFEILSHCISDTYVGKRRTAEKLLVPSVACERMKRYEWINCVHNALEYVITTFQEYQFL